MEIASVLDGILGTLASSWPVLTNTDVRIDLLRDSFEICFFASAISSTLQKFDVFLDWLRCCSL